MAVITLRIWGTLKKDLLPEIEKQSFYSKPVENSPLLASFYYNSYKAKAAITACLKLHLNVEEKIGNINYVYHYSGCAPVKIKTKPNGDPLVGLDQILKNIEKGESIESIRSIYGRHEVGSFEVTE